jgi:hypothetical protein
MFRDAVYVDLIVDAIETVLAWDLSDECISEAVLDRARLLAGASHDSSDDIGLH